MNYQAGFLCPNYSVIIIYHFLARIECGMSGGASLNCTAWSSTYRKWTPDICVKRYSKVLGWIDLPGLPVPSLFYFRVWSEAIRFAHGAGRRHFSLKVFISYGLISKENKLSSCSSARRLFSMRSHSQAFRILAPNVSWTPDLLL